VGQLLNCREFCKREVERGKRNGTHETEIGKRRKFSAVQQLGYLEG
jgi:hypothetical protein